MDWESFFKDHKIYYTFPSDSHNVGVGWLGLKCPFCGTSDHSDHMGVRVGGFGYSCWRSSNHRGRKPHTLIMELLKCSYDRADQIVQLYSDGVAKLNELEKTLNKMSAEYNKNTEKLKESTELSWPDHFRKLAYDTRRAALPFRNYLIHERKFSEDDIDLLAHMYDLHYCISGYWSNRIIMPIYDTECNMVAWTGRAIGDHKRRYVSLSPNEEKRQWQEGICAIKATTECLGGQPWVPLENDNVLIVVEGPLDFIKLDFYGCLTDVCATCLFGKEINNTQMKLLSSLSKKYELKYLLLDPEFELDQIRHLDKLSYIGFKSAPSLPEGVSDPGDLNHVQALEYTASLKELT